MYNKFNSKIELPEVFNCLVHPSIHCYIHNMLVISFGENNPTICSAPPLLYILSHVLFHFKIGTDILGKKRWTTFVRHIFLSSQCVDGDSQWFSMLWLVFLPIYYSYLSSCWCKPEHNFTWPPYWLAFMFFPYQHKGFSFPLHVLTTIIREFDGTCCAYLYESL